MSVRVLLDENAVVFGEVRAVNQHLRVTEVTRLQEQSELTRARGLAELHGHATLGVLDELRVLGVPAQPHHTGDLNLRNNPGFLAAFSAREFVAAVRDLLLAGVVHLNHNVLKVAPHRRRGAVITNL